MTGSPAVPSVRVEVQLGAPLAPLLPELVGRRPALVAGVVSLMRGFSLHGGADVRLSAATTPRPLSVSVDGSVLPVNTATIAHLWGALADPPLVHLAWAGRRNDPGFTEELLEELVSARIAPGVAAEFLQAAVLEVVKDSAGSLVPDGDASRLIGRGLVSAELIGSFTPRTLASVWRWLLSMDVSVPDPGVVLESLALSFRVGRSEADAAEAAYRLLHGSAIQLEGHPDYLSTLLRGAAIEGPTAARDERMDDAVRDGHRNIVDLLRSDLGLELPVVNWAPSRDLRPGVLGVRINHRVVLRSGLAPGELLVGGTPEQVAYFGCPARPWPDPVLGTRWSVIATGATGCEEAVSRYGAWNDLETAYLTLYSEVSRRASRLIAVDVVEALLARLGRSSPELVQSVTARFRIGELTGLLRGMVAEGLSGADLRGILERALLFDTVHVPDEGLQVLDDRLPVSDEDGESVHRLVGFVRRGRRAQVTRHQAGDANVIVVHRLDRDHESGTASDLLAAVRDSVRAGGDRFRPAVLTSDAARAWVRAVIAAELPTVQVIGESEVRPGTRVAAVNQPGGVMAVETSMLKDYVERLLTGFVGPVPVETDEDGDLTFRYKSVQVYIRVSNVSGDGIVAVFSITNCDVPPSPELFRWVATRADDLLFGHVAASEAPAGVVVAVRHALLGDYLDPQELFTAVNNVTGIAAEVASEVRNQFGGRLFTDQPAVESVPDAEPNPA